MTLLPYGKSVSSFLFVSPSLAQVKFISIHSTIELPINRKKIEHGSTSREFEQNYHKKNL